MLLQVGSRKCEITWLLEAFRIKPRSFSQLAIAEADADRIADTSDLVDRANMMDVLVNNAIRRIQVPRQRAHPPKNKKTLIFRLEDHGLHSLCYVCHPKTCAIKCYAKVPGRLHNEAARVP